MQDNFIQHAGPCPIDRNVISTCYPGESDGLHYAMWSGGCDSTLLLYELLETYGPDRVVIISYHYPWLNAMKTKSEQAHRDAFKAKLCTMDAKYYNLRHTEIEVNLNLISGNRIDVFASSGGLPQAVAWLLSAPIYGANHTYFYNGAIRSDDLTLRLESYYQLFRGIVGTLDRKLYLREPYLYMSKANVLEKLIRYELYDETWFCELPEVEQVPCCKCNPCKTHMAALIELSLGDPTDYVTIVATQKLAAINALRHKGTRDTVL